MLKLIRRLIRAWRLARSIQRSFGRRIVPEGTKSRSGISFIDHKPFWLDLEEKKRRSCGYERYSSGRTYKADRKPDGNGTSAPVQASGR